MNERIKQAIYRVRQDHVSGQLSALECTARELADEVERLRRALGAIAESRDMTLLGQADCGCPRRSHELGAVKAFNQSAEMAEAALTDPEAFV